MFLNTSRRLVSTQRPEENRSTNELRCGHLFFVLYYYGYQEYCPGVNSRMSGWYNSHEREKSFAQLVIFKRKIRGDIHDIKEV
jgi:hypothetical protein